MATSSPWSRLRRRLQRYEEASSRLPEDEGLRASVNVHHLQQLLQAVDDALDDELIRARELGATWQAIGYGTSKQAAQQRHKRAVKKRDTAAQRRRLQSGDIPEIMP